ncbi:MarR family winged helix-turn-helix transcriptional regulator [Bacillus cereus]|uniref:MarR family winged helix-turn-helix transcriptional regulator n=1 Tax=Bacillus cereus TaxID=1396 RepID=UPI000BF55D42|nr:MarR family transcriptional regulator [Bacillus cereus]PFB13680.1 MarR family transcriptional regulator [Bacillus cereus]
MELNECMNFLLSVTQNKVFKYFSRYLGEYDITPAQYGVLNCLWTEGKISPKRIGELLYLEAPTVSGILDKMQKLNLIVREIDPNNRRNVLVTSTEKADQIRNAIKKASNEMNINVLQELNDQEKEALKKGLYKIIKTELSY